MNSIWPATLFSAVGPDEVQLLGVLELGRASVAPLFAWSNGRMPRNFGSSIILTLWPGVALTAAAADAEAIAAGEALAAAEALGAAEVAAADGVAATVGAAAEAATEAAADGEPPMSCSRSR